MSDLYYVHATEFPNGILANGPPIDAEFAKISLAFSLLPAPDGNGGFAVPFPIAAATDPTHAMQYGQFLVWPTDVNVNGHFLRNVPDPVSDDEAANRRYVNAAIAATILMGGLPGSVPVTSLGAGTLADGQILKRAGSSLVGTNFDMNTIGKGTATPLQQWRVKADGSGVEPFTPSDDPLGRAASAVFAYQNF